MKTNSALRSRSRSLLAGFLAILIAQGSLPFHAAPAWAEEGGDASGGGGEKSGDFGQGLKQAFLGNMTIGQIKSEFKKECESDLNHVKNGQGGQGSKGNLDAAALAQKVPMCGLVKTSIQTAEIERVLQITYTVVTAVCTTACIASKIPFGQFMEGVCTIADVVGSAAELAGGVALSIVAKDVSGAVQNVLSAGTGIQDGISKFGEGTSKLSKDSMAQARANFKKTGNAKKDSKQKSESCSTAAMAAIQMVMHLMKKNSAKGMAEDTLANIKNLKSDPTNGGPTMELAKQDLKNQESLTLQNRVSPNARQGVVGSGDQNMGGSTNPCGGPGGTAGMLSCAMANANGGLQGFKDQRIADAIDRKLGPGWMDRDFNTNQEMAQALAEISGANNFEPVIAAATAAANDPAVAAALNGTPAPVEPVKYTQSSGENREPAAAADPSIEDMMKAMMGENGKKEEGPTFDHELEFRYNKDPRSIAEDPKVDIFKRVSFRYRAVDKRAGVTSALTGAGGAPAMNGMH